RDWLRKGILIILPFAPKPNRRLPLVTLNPGAYLIRWWAWSSKPLGGPKRPPIGSTPIRSRHASNYPANRLVWFVSEDRGRVAGQAAPDPYKAPCVGAGHARPAATAQIYMGRALGEWKANTEFVTEKRNLAASAGV